MGKVAESLKSIAATFPLDPKKLVGQQVGVASWYPYYAGFSDQFAKTILENSRLEREAIVLDPWNGSGTTTYMADKLGFTALGFDINPVASLVANAKLTRAKDAQHVLGLARRIAEDELGAPSQGQIANDSLLAWLMPGLVSRYRGIEAGVLADLGSNCKGEAIQPISGNVPPLASFLLLALMRAARLPRYALRQTQHGFNQAREGGVNGRH
jgi:hypothetical protein